MEITHEKIPTLEDKVSLEDWTANHIITGFPSGTFKLHQLLQTHTFPGDTNTVTVSGLDGALYDAIFLECFFSLASFNLPSLYLRINGDSGNNYKRRGFYQDDTSNIYGESANDTSYRVGIGPFNAASYGYFNLYITALDGQRHFINGYSQVLKSDGTGRRYWIGGHHENTTKITQYQLYTGGNNFNSGSVLKTYALSTVTL